jgi:hypothetical protein
MVDFPAHHGWSISATGSSCGSSGWYRVCDLFGASWQLRLYLDMSQHLCMILWYCMTCVYIYTYTYTLIYICIYVYIYSIIFNTTKLGRNIWGPLKLLRYWPIPMCLLFVFFCGIMSVSAFWNSSLSSFGILWGIPVGPLRNWRSNEGIWKALPCDHSFHQVGTDDQNCWLPVDFGRSFIHFIYLYTSLDIFIYL